MKITIIQKDQYGKTVFYPNCNISNGLADLLQQKTLTRSDLLKIKSMGFEIEIKQTVVEFN